MRGIIFKKVAAGFYALRVKENHNTLIYLGSSIFSSVIGIVMLRFFTKYLGPEDIGIFGYVTAINGFLIPCFSLNFQTFYSKEFFLRHDLNEQKDLLGTLLNFSLIWTIFLTILLVFSGKLFFSMLHIKFPFFPFMFLTLLSNLLSASTNFILIQYRIKSKAWHYSLIVSLQTLLLIGLGYYFVGVAHWGIYGRIFGVFLGSLILGALCFLLLRKSLNPVLKRDIFKKALKFSLPLIPYSIAVMLFDVLDRFFLERYSVNMASTGIYNMGAQYAGILSLLSMSFYRAYEPVIFKLASQENEKEICKNLITLNNVMLFISVPLILSSGWLIGFLTHGKFSGSEFIASLLIVAFFLKSGYIMVNTVLSAMNRTKEMMYFSFGGVVLMIVFSIWLVPVYNNIGTAVVKALLYGALFLISFFIIRKSLIYRPFLLHTIFCAILLILLIILLKNFHYS